MKEITKKDHSTSKSCFLQRFSGKLNVITKHGEIDNENSFKLPKINTSLSKRSNTLNMRPAKESSESFFSNSRSMGNKSLIIRNHAKKFLTLNNEKQNIDLKNMYLKKKDTQDLKKSSRRQVTMEPLSAQPVSKRFKSGRHNTIGDQQQSYSKFIANGNKMRNSDYHNFLSELNQVSDAINQRRRTIKRQEKENQNIQNEAG